MIVSSGSFEEACRTLFEDLPPQAVIDVEIEGGGEVQIGDHTWETEPTLIVISAFIPGVDRRPDLRQHRGKTWRRTFDTLPELWEALSG